ncbi:MAG TPA: dTMP kinase [Firmicutes bacterium]|nr:dTMP kinase [Candidatus Fermentithermobacillaceae bacterium]
MRGLLVTFEGCDGTGKSTQISLLVRRLRDLGYRVFATREPGGTPVGEAIRSLLLDTHGPDRTALAEALLYAASRAELVRKVLVPALYENQFVVVERFTDSTLVYQGIAGGVPIDEIEQINRIATGGLSPDLTILLDADDLSEIDRRIRSGRAKDKIESRGQAYQVRVRDGYRSLARRYPERIKVVVPSGTPDEVSDQVLALVLARAEEVFTREGGEGACRRAAQGTGFPERPL